MLQVEEPVVAQNQMPFASDWLTLDLNTSVDSFKYLYRAAARCFGY